MLISHPPGFQRTLSISYRISIFSCLSINKEVHGLDIEPVSTRVHLVLADTACDKVEFDLVDSVDWA